MTKFQGHTIVFKKFDPKQEFLDKLHEIQTSYTIHSNEREKEKEKTEERYSLQMEFQDQQATLYYSQYIQKISLKPVKQIEEMEE